MNVYEFYTTSGAFDLYGCSGTITVTTLEIWGVGVGVETQAGGDPWATLLPLSVKPCLR